MLRSIIINVPKLGVGVRSSRFPTPAALALNRYYTSQNNNRENTIERNVRVRYAPSPTGEIRIYELNPFKSK